MANPQDIIRKNTVVVDDGSGVILQPMTKEYSYVVTAKHVIQNDKDDVSKGFKSLENISIYTVSDSKLKPVDFIYHPVLDLAIIKIDYHHSNIQVFDGHLQRDDRIELWGFPNYNSEKHRNNSVSKDKWLECYVANVVKSTDELIESAPTENPEITGLQGFSGGGQWILKGNKAFLCTIEYKVTTPDSYVNRLCAISAKRISQLLQLNDWQIIKPVYFACFKELESEVFDSLEFQTENNRKKFINTLAMHSNNKAEPKEFSPLHLIQKTNGFVNTIMKDPNSLDNKRIWISVLEFLQTYEILSPQNSWDNEFIEYLSCRYKFLYLGNESWRKNINSIVLFDCEDLNEGGMLVLLQDKENRIFPDTPDYISKYVNPEKLLRNIADSMNDPQSIARANSNNLKGLKIIHMKMLHEFRIDDLEENLEPLTMLSDGDQIKKLLVDRYSEYIKHNE